MKIVVLVVFVIVGFLEVFVESYVPLRMSPIISSSNSRLEAKLTPKPPTSSSVGSDFYEIGSSLITILNLAQEISSSRNVRFRQAADKLRQQFARSFSMRYDIEKSQFLSTALASIDGDDKLTEEQVVLRDTILMQLRSIERRASSIIFFNEPLPNLDEFKYPFDFPYDALDSCQLVDTSASTDGKTSAIGSLGRQQQQQDTESAIEKRNAQYVQSLLDRFKGSEDKAAMRMTENDLTKLKLGLRVEARRWRAEAARLMTTSVAAAAAAAASAEKVKNTANELFVEPVVREILQREAELSESDPSSPTPQDENSPLSVVSSAVQIPSPPPSPPPPGPVSDEDNVQIKRVIKHFRKVTDNMPEKAHLYTL